MRSLNRTSRESMISVFASLARPLAVVGVIVLATCRSPVFSSPEQPPSEPSPAASESNVPVKDKHHAYFEYRRLRDGVSPEILASGLASLPLALDQKGALPVRGGPWVSLGPAPITGNPFHGPASGRVLALAAGSVLGPIYLGAADGGVWRSTDEGASWTPLTDDMPSLAIGALAVHPREKSIIYAGTGEFANCADPPPCLYGVGVYVSPAGGDPGSWTLHGNDIFQRTAISAIRVSPADRVYAAVVSKIDPATAGVAVSEDLGEHWSFPVNVLTGKDVTDLVIDNYGHLYAAVSGHGRGCIPSDGCGIYYSDTQGMTWSLASNGLPNTGGLIYKLALAPSTADNPRSQQILFTVIGDAATRSILGVYGTVNGGAQWIQVGTRAALRDCGNQAWYDIYIAVDPANPNVVYVGLTDIYKTTNAGSTWTNLTNYYQTYWNGTTCVFDPTLVRAPVHPDQHALLFRGGTTYFGNDGGVYKSTDAGSTFSPAIGNLAITQFYGGALSHGSGAILGGTQDNGTVQTTDSGWTERLGGDGCYTAYDFADSNLAYTEQPYGRTHRSTDAGASFRVAITGMPAPDSRGRIDDALFAAPLVMDPLDPNLLYSGHSHLWRSPDNMRNWTNVGPSSGTFGISAIALAPSDTRTIYIADIDGRLWVSNNGGGTWCGFLDGCHLLPRLPPGSFITGLAVDPQYRDIVYAAVNGLQGGQRRHLFRSPDGGRTWADLSTTLPDVPFQSVAVHSIHGPRVYAGTNLGVYVSANSGQSWNRFGTELPNAAVYQLVLSRNGENLYAFTHGRGAWRSPDALCPVAPSPDGVACGTWGATGRLPTGRELHTATLLFDGTVLVTGGADDEGISATAVRYEPTTESWTSAGRMSVPRYLHTATLLGDGRVLVAGGDTGAFEFPRTAELYNPTTNTWSPTGSLANGRREHTATVLVDGTVLVVGGVNRSGMLATAERYDPITGNWSSAGSMNTRRRLHTATRLPDGTVLVVGGQSMEFGEGSAELYNPTTGTWTMTERPTVGRGAHTATLLTDGTVLVVGGFTNPTSAERYDPATGIWSSAGSMATGRWFHGGTILAGGNVLVAGGQGPGARPLATAELYDPETNTWSGTGSLNAVRFYHTTTLLTDGTVLVTGGITHTGPTISTAERYHPGTSPPGE